jgi:superfamily II helicase
MKKAHEMRMKPKTEASPEVLVPVDLMGVKKGVDVDSMEEEEEVSPDFIKRYTRLKWECLRMGVSLTVLQYPKTSTLQTAKGKIVGAPNLHYSLGGKMRHLKKHEKQEPLCAIPLDEYKLMTSTQQFSFEKEIEAEQRWSKLSLDICQVCNGCHLTKMSRTMVEGHTTKGQHKPICGSCAHNTARNTAHNRVIPYWLDRHRTIHTYVPREFSDLTFA